ncbi:15906_t:CDS:2, partial [Gigaspora rosea]
MNAFVENNEFKFRFFGNILRIELVIITASVNAIPTQLGKRTSDYEPNFPLSLTVIPDNLVPNMNTSYTISTQIYKRTSGYSPCFPNKPGLSVTTNPANLAPNTKTQFNRWIYRFNGEEYSCPNIKCPCDSNRVLISTNIVMKNIPDKYYIVVDIFLSSHARQPDA